MLPSDQLRASVVPPDFLLTPSEQSQRDQRSVFGLEALEEWSDGEQIEDHVEEVQMHQGKQIEPVHCAKEGDISF